MNDLRSRAVLTGALVDLLGTFVLGELFFLVLSATSGATTPEELARAYDASTSLQVVLLALGLSMTAAGAYVAARLAPGAERLHAFAVGVISTLIGFTIVFADPATGPFWAQAASLILTVPAAFAGGEIRRATAGPPRRSP